VSYYLPVLGSHNVLKYCSPLQEIVNVDDTVNSVICVLRNMSWKIIYFIDTGCKEGIRAYVSTTHKRKSKYHYHDVLYQW
jgi:hypothetical protein